MNRVPTGVDRLDDMLGGGLPAGASVLVLGPAFLGKEVLTRRFFRRGVENEEPGLMVLTADTAQDVRAGLSATDARYPDLEKKGLARFVDAYSRSIGAEDDAPCCHYVGGPVDLNAISVAVNEAHRRFIGDHPRHRMVVDSVSTLITYTNAQTVFRFLQVLLGKAKRSGATTMLLMDNGMHTEAEVEMFKHLAAGVIEVRQAENTTQLRVQGAGVTTDVGWVDYAFTEDSFEITGSFAAGRIR